MPQSLNDPKVLQGHLDVVYPDKWIAAHLVASMTDLKELQDTKNNLEAKLEQCKQGIQIIHTIRGSLRGGATVRAE